MTTAGASAALLGLLLEAIPIRLDVIADSKGRWLAIARATFYNFIALFALSLLMLFPATDNQLRGAMLIVVTGFGLFRLLTAWLPVWRGILGAHRERIVEILWMHSRRGIFRSASSDAIAQASCRIGDWSHPLGSEYVIHGTMTERSPQDLTASMRLARYGSLGA